MLKFSAVNWLPDNDTVVLSDISFEVREGEFCCLVGPSGAGKTTLLRLAAGLISPNSGSVHIDGRTPIESRDRLSFIFQHPVLFPWRTVSENLLLPLEIKGNGQQEGLVDQYLKQVNLDGVGDLFPKQLSGGMQSRVAIARALITEPSLLLMDEPFSDLDEINREHLNLELQRIWIEKKRTVLFVTHDLSEAVFLADRIIVLSSKPATVFADIKVTLPRPRTEAVFDTTEFDDILKQVRHTLRSAAKAHDGYSYG